MGAINVKHTGSGADIALSSDGTSLLLDGTAIGGGGGSPSAITLETRSTTNTIVAADLGKIIFMSNTGNVTLPDAATVGSGWFVTIKIANTRSSGNNILYSGGTIMGINNSYPLDPGMSLKLISDGTNWISDRSGSHMFAYQTNGSKDAARASGNRSIAVGDGANAGSTYATALGKNAKATGVNSLAIGSTNASTNATGTRSTAIGACSSSLGSQSSGSGATALGGSYASGTDSFAAAIANNTSSYGAVGASSIAIGSFAKANSTGSAVIGQSTGVYANYGTAIGYASACYGQYGVAIGDTCSVAATNAVAIGDRAYTSGPGSFALGTQSKTTKSYQFAYSAGQFSGLGDAQTSMYVLRSDTTDATPEALTTDNSAAGTTDQIILSNNSAYSFHGTIVARQQASQGTATAAWKVEGLIRREGSAGTTVLVNSATTILDNTPAWGMALSADTTNGGLKIEVTGAAATNIRFVGTINTSEVTY